MGLEARCAIAIPTPLPREVMLEILLGARLTGSHLRITLGRSWVGCVYVVCPLRVALRS
jgi:hypothetical protein